MGVSGCRQSQQRLEQPLHMRHREQIVAACHQIHALIGVVHHDGEVVSGGRFLARQDDVAEFQWVDRNPSRLAVRS